MKTLLVMAVANLASAVSDALMSVGMKQVGDVSAAGARSFKMLAMFGNRSVVLAILFSTVYFFLYSSTLSWAELSYAQPLNALTFVFAALFARFWLHEGFSMTRSLGVVTIIVGVILISWDQRPAPALK